MKQNISSHFESFLRFIFGCFQFLNNSTQSNNNITFHFFGQVTVKTLFLFLQ